MRWTTKVHHVADLMRDMGLDVHQLAATTGLEDRVVDAIASERYTPTLQQRQQISQALGVPWTDICWGHRSLVEHLRSWGR